MIYYNIKHDFYEESTAFNEFPEYTVVSVPHT